MFAVARVPRTRDRASCGSCEPVRMDGRGGRRRYGASGWSRAASRRPGRRARIPGSPNPRGDRSRASLERAASPRRSAPPGFDDASRASARQGRDTHVRRHRLCAVVRYPRRVRKRRRCARDRSFWEGRVFQPGLRVCRRARGGRSRPRARAKKIRAIAAHRRLLLRGARRRGVSRVAAGSAGEDARRPGRACPSRFARSSVDAPPSPCRALVAGARGEKSTRRVDAAHVRVRPPTPPLPRGSDDAPDRDHRLVAPHRHVPRVAIPPRAEPLTPGARALERARPPALT